MKRYSILLVAAAPLAACAGSGAVPTQPAVTLGPSAIQVAVASRNFLVGQPRLPILLFDGVKRVADARRVTLTAFDLTGGTPVPGGWSGAATNYSRYQTLRQT